MARTRTVRHKTSKGRRTLNVADTPHIQTRKMVKGKYHIYIIRFVIVLIAMYLFALPAFTESRFVEMPGMVITANAKTKKLQPDSPDKLPDSAAETVNSLNKKIGKVLQVAGAIVVALGIVTIITAFSEQSMQSKTRGAMMIGGGVFLLAINSVMNVISEGYKSNHQTGAAKAVLEQIGIALGYAGIVIAAFGIIQMILAFKDSSAEERSNGLRSLATGTAFLSGKQIMTGVSYLLTIRNKSYVGQAAAGYVIKYIIARPITYVGVGLAVFGVIQIIMGFKDEDPSAKHQGSLILITGIALASILSIFNATMGITNKNYNSVMNDKSTKISAPKTRKNGDSSSSGWNQIFK